tara:strand:- start:1334 stop:1537 length:204 start_codon:yes stop_codon:yes gene_type:complete
MRIIIYILVFLISSCSAKYTVVQELDSNMYHLYSEKKGVVIIFTNDKLEIDKSYRLKQIDVLKPESE